MEPLVSVKELFTWLCIRPVDGTISEWKKTARVPIAIANLAVMVSHFTASLVFFIRFVTTDLPGSLFAFMCCCGDFSIVYILITAFILRHRVNEIFEKLSAIYSACKYHFEFIRGVNYVADVFFSIQMEAPIRTNSWLAQTTIASGGGESTANTC